MIEEGAHRVIALLPPFSQASPALLLQVSPAQASPVLPLQTSPASPAQVSPAQAAAVQVSLTETSPVQARLALRSSPALLLPVFPVSRARFVSLAIIHDRVYQRRQSIRICEQRKTLFHHTVRRQCCATYLEIVMICLVCNLLPTGSHVSWGASKDNQPRSHHFLLFPRLYKRTQPFAPRSA